MLQLRAEQVPETRARYCGVPRGGRCLRSSPSVGWGKVKGSWKLQQELGWEERGVKEGGEGLGGWLEAWGWDLPGGLWLLEGVCVVVWVSVDVCKAEWVPVIPACPCSILRVFPPPQLACGGTNPAQRARVLAQDPQLRTAAILSPPQPPQHLCSASLALQPPTASPLHTPPPFFFMPPPCRSPPGWKGLGGVCCPQAPIPRSAAFPSQNLAPVRAVQGVRGDPGRC